MNQPDNVQPIDRYHLDSCRSFKATRGIWPNSRVLTGEPCSCGLVELIAAETKKAQEYQIGIRICNEKLGIWGLSIARYGRTVYSNIYRTEQEAKDDVDNVIAQLQKEAKQ